MPKLTQPQTIKPHMYNNSKGGYSRNNAVKLCNSSRTKSSSSGSGVGTQASISV